MKEEMKKKAVLTGTALTSGSVSAAFTTAAMNRMKGDDNPDSPKEDEVTIVEPVPDEPQPAPHPAPSPTTEPTPSPEPIPVPSPEQEPIIEPAPVPEPEPNPIIDPISDMYMPNIIEDPTIDPLLIEPEPLMYGGPEDFDDEEPYIDDDRDDEEDEMDDEDDYLAGDNTLDDNDLCCD